MRLRVRPLGIDTHQEVVVFLARDTLASALPGIRPMDRIEIITPDRRVLAVVNTVDGALVGPDEIGLAEPAATRVGMPAGSFVDARPAGPPPSAAALRAKVEGRRLERDEMRRIVQDIVDGYYSKVEMTAFVVASTLHRLDDAEVIALVEAMVETGQRLVWDPDVVVDKHSIGGIPGNRTTPIVTSIVAAAGLTMPKTSSRAVTSASGTADTMATLMDVALPLPRIREVVAQAGACLVWGGGLHLVPADDLLIRVEHPLEIDSEALMLASILSKKVAAGATHVVLDIPVGPQAKARDAAHGSELARRFERIGDAVGLHVRALLTDGTQPVGRGVGPALEARDVLAVLAREPSAPRDLAEKSVALAGEVLEMAGVAEAGAGRTRAQAILASGEAEAKFAQIRRLQGAREPPPLAPHVSRLAAARDGRVAAIATREVARAAKLAGSPQWPGAGVIVHHRVGERVTRGEPLLTVHATSEAALGFAMRHLTERVDVISVE